MIQIPLLDLKAQYATIKDEVDAAVAEVFASQYFILGPQVKALEEALADYCNCPAAIGVSSGTDALLISLMAAGIGPDDEVITTPYTFFATAGCIHRVGARPVFVDIDPETFNIDVTKVGAAVTEKTRAIIPVHLYGQVVDMEPLLDIARAHDLLVIEDAAQAVGAEHSGQRAGSFGDYGCFSFFPSKNLGGAGDGGMVTCRDAERADRVELLRVHGSRPKYYHQEVGGNFRLDALQAAVVGVKLKHLDQWTAGRQHNAGRYTERFAQYGLSGAEGPVKPPPIRANRHIFNQFVPRFRKRDELRAFLKDNGVATEIYYPVPLHLQDCFAYLGHQPGDFPESERAAGETLALPIYPELSDEQLCYVVEQIARFYA